MSVPATGVAITLLVLAGCGSDSAPPATPTQPTAPAPAPTPPAVTVSSVTVGVAGSQPATLAPGEKLQLFAQATLSDNTVVDVTNTAVWQSSNPALATVAAGGILTGFAEGAIDVSATYQSRAGSLRADVAKAGCRVTLNPPSLSFGALSSSGSVAVTTNLSDCRWTAKSNTTWLALSYDPGRSGSGSFSYTVPGNNNTDPRDADIVVSVAGGPTVVHRVHQERPLGCVYTVKPAKLNFGSGGGAGSFEVTTQPADCQWRIDDSWSYLSNLGPKSGTGAATVTYTALPNPFTFDLELTLSVRGLSGLNPPGVHTIVIARK